MSSDGQLVRTSVESLLPPSISWIEPTGYRESLALCVVDAVFSLRATYGSTVRVLDRYRAVRRAAGADPNLDDLGDLVGAIDGVGGPVLAAKGVLFDNRAVAPGTARSGRPGVLKAAVVYEAATRLRALGVTDIGELHNRPAEAAASWLEVRGLGRVSWEYLRMLSGAEGVKADTMIRRFVARAVGASGVSDERAQRAVEGAAQLMKVDARVLDHAIWLYERGPRSGVRNRPGGAAP